MIPPGRSLDRHDARTKRSLRLPAQPATSSGTSPARRVHAGDDDPGDGGGLAGLRPDQGPALAGAGRAGRGAAVHRRRPLRGARRRPPRPQAPLPARDRRPDARRGSCCSPTRYGRRCSPAGRVWPIYAVVFLSGIARSFLQPARTALGAEIVPRETYANAVAWRSSLWQLAAVVGPAVGGLLYGFSGARAAYAAEAALCAGRLTPLLRDRLHAPTRGRPQEGSDRRKPHDRHPLPAHPAGAARRAAARPLLRALRRRGGAAADLRLRDPARRARGARRAPRRSRRRRRADVRLPGAPEAAARRADAASCASPGSGSAGSSSPSRGRSGCRWPCWPSAACWTASAW